VDHSPYRTRPTRLSDVEYEDVPAAALHGEVAPRPRTVDDEAARRRYAHYGRFTPVVVRRVRSRMLVSIFGFPVLNAATTWLGAVELGFGTTFAQLPVAALFGFLLGYCRPPVTVVALMMLGASLAMQALAGTLVLSFAGAAGYPIYFGIGMAIGWNEEMAICDGR
jgi:hypothetical protein